MKILVTGGAGQLGRHLAAHAHVTALDRHGLNICDPESVEAALALHQPHTVIHAAAYANVDGCTADPARAFQVNAGGTELVARACAARNIRMLHISTDYVLTGPDTGGYRLPVNLPPNPQSTYARSKLAAELSARAFGAHVVRVQWIYSHSASGFVNRALAAMQQGRSVPLVTDQFGCPTPAPLLARWLVELAGTPNLPPILHLATTGEATAAEWVCALARASGISPVWHPISRRELTAGTRPARSCLDTSQTAPLLNAPIPDWQEALEDHCRMVGSPGCPVG